MNVQLYFCNTLNAKIGGLCKIDLSFFFEQTFSFYHLVNLYTKNLTIK